MMMPGNGQNPGSGNDQNNGNGAAPSGTPGNGQNGQNPGRDANPFAGNGTAPQGRPDQNFGNASWNATPPGPGGDLNLTALGNTLFGQLPPDANATAGNNWTIPFNATGPRPDGQNVPQPAGNLTGQNPADGNVTPPVQPAHSGSGNANNGGNQVGSGAAQTSSASQSQKDSDLIAAFLKWLQGGGNTS
jgi:hypothetical protein